MFRHAMTIAIVLLGFASASFAKTLKVGLLTSYGAQGMHEAFAQEDGIEAVVLTNLSPETIYGYDVIVLGSVKGGLPRREDARNLLVYAQCGGGILLNHDATGYRGWDDSLFPQHFRGVGKLRHKVVKVTGGEHPAVSGVPTEFEHGYFDHITLEKRVDGQVLATDEQGDPVVVIGAVGEGRVAGCGLVMGFTYEKGKGQFEHPPSGGERALLRSLVNWLGHAGISGLDETELASRKRKAIERLRLVAAATVVEGEAITETGQRDEHWFTPARMNEQVYVHPPISEMGGRFFLFDGGIMAIANRGNRGRHPDEIRAILQQLKWAGVTDVIGLSTGPMRFKYPTKVADATFLSRTHAFGYDWLEEMEAACHEVGIGFWCMWHPNVASDDAEDPRLAPYLIHDAQGKPYSHYLDILEPKLIAKSKEVIDELVDRYNKHGAIKGIYLDELWHPFVYDYLEDDIPSFVSYSEKQFGEKPPSDIADKFALGPDWRDPNDVWWRRYFLWRSTLIPNYVREITEYANSRGLQVMNTAPISLQLEMGWWDGLGNTYALSQEGNLLFGYEWQTQYTFEQYPRNRLVLGNHSVSPSGQASISLVRGHYGSLFTFGSSWFPLALGKNPRGGKVMLEQIRANREWYGAQPVYQSAVLVNVVAKQMRMINSHSHHAANNVAVREALAATTPTAMQLVRDVTHFGRYKNLIAPDQSLECLPKQSYRQLHQFISEGGQLLAISGNVSAANPDHTIVNDHTSDLLGIVRGTDTQKSAKAIQFAGGAKFSFPAISYQLPISVDKQITVLATLEGSETPLITQHTIGKGCVVTFHFDLTALLRSSETQTQAVQLVDHLLHRQVKPAIRATGDLHVYSAVRKGNWIVVSLLGKKNKDQPNKPTYPAAGRVYFDLEQFGIKAERFKAVSLARGREMMPQGEDFNLWGGNYWTTQLLSSKGVEVYIAPDSGVNLEVDYESDDDYVQRWILPRWRQYRNARTYEHEIIAVAPVGEASMLNREWEKRRD